MTAERQYEMYARSVPVLTPIRERELSNVILGDDSVVKNAAIIELVESNMRLVLNLTRKYRSNPEYTDILFDGNLGLTKAAATFDANKGKFSTWATPKIRTEIRDGIYLRSSAVASLRSAREVIDRAEQDGRHRDADIIRLAIAGTVPLYDDDGKPIEIEDVSVISAAEQVHKHELIALVNKAVVELGLSEDDISLVSNGDDQGTVVSSIAEKLGVTKSCVRMKKVKLLWMLRKKILGYVGKDEYLILSAWDDIPGSSWK